MKLEDLETKCERCQGKGVIKEIGMDEYRTCFNCNGKKVFLTELGKQLLDFFQRHIEIKTEIKE